MPKPQSIRAAERYLNAAGAEPRPHNHPQDMANPPSPGAGDTAGAATTVSSDAAWLLDEIRRKDDETGVVVGGEGRDELVVDSGHG